MNSSIYKYKPLVFCVASALLLSACATSETAKYQPGRSYLEKVPGQSAPQQEQQQGSRVGQSDSAVGNEQRQLGLSYLSPLKFQQQQSVDEVDLTTKFSDNKMVRLTADDLALKDFLHHVMGDLLGVSYILGDQVQADTQAVTLNLQQDISQRKLFTLSEELLTQRGYVLRFDDGIFYIHKEGTAAGQGDIAYGYGNKADNVPTTSLDVIQMVPFDFGLQNQLSLVLSSIAKVKVTADPGHNALILRGKRREILKALDFISLMDQGGFKNRQIGMYKTVFVSNEQLSKKLIELLNQEGISVGTASDNNKAVSLVSLDRIGTMIFFANDKTVLERVGFWAEKVDQPSSGNELQYFMYLPQFSRAADLGESLQALIGGAVGGSALSDQTSASTQNQQVKTQAQSSGAIVASSDKVRLVVDQRANSVIIQSTGEDYRKLLPLIKRLDVMPKQVMLEVMIAEVTLSDEFKQGVEFALSQGDYSLSTKGAFGATGFGGLSYLLTGSNGQIAMNFFQTNSLVNVLSRPSLVVRDGVAATITVGDNIPVIGQTTQDPVSGDRQTTSIEYRRTGIELTVTPTINAQGVVIMEIAQKISNQLESGSAIAGAPAIFERSLNTEVVAESAQTIILGGLISENKTTSNTGVPLLSRLPVLGKLFDADTDRGQKTELVIMVTPKIIESSDEWQDIKTKFASGLSKININ